MVSNKSLRGQIITAKRSRSSRFERKPFFKGKCHYTFVLQSGESKEKKDMQNTLYLHFETTDFWVAAFKQASETPEAETALATDPLAENKLSANTENLCVFDPWLPNSLKVLAKRELVESISTKRKKEPRWSHAIAESWHLALRSLLLCEALITNDTAITGSKSCDRICTTSWWFRFLSLTNHVKERSDIFTITMHNHCSHY